MRVRKRFISARPSAVVATGSARPSEGSGVRLDEAELLEARDDAGRRRALDALALGELARRERAVALDGRERRGQGGAELAAPLGSERLLAQPA